LFSTVKFANAAIVEFNFTGGKTSADQIWLLGVAGVKIALFELLDVLYGFQASQALLHIHPAPASAKDAVGTRHLVLTTDCAAEIL
jgi:hypothetical protein